MKELKSIIYCVICFSTTSIICMNLPKTGFPKWDGLSDLRNAGLPVPDGEFIPPNSSEKRIIELFERFTSRCRTQLLALRPDGKNGIGATPPGITFDKDHKERILGKIIEWTNQGYGTTVLETHNRFDYDFCCNMLLDSNGNFTAEFVGPGYDGGDLNKSILLPTMVVQNKPESPIFYYYDPLSDEPNIELLDHLYHRISIEGRAPTEKEIETRFNYMIEKLLPDMGVYIGPSRKSIVEWLKNNNSARFLEKINPRTCVSLEDLKTIILATARYAHNLVHRGISLDAMALTAHKYNGRILFFGTYNGKKWGNPSHKHF